MLFDLIRVYRGQPYQSCNHWVSPSPRQPLVIPNNPLMIRMSQTTLNSNLQASKLVNLVNLVNPISLLASKLVNQSNLAINLRSCPMTPTPPSNKWVMPRWFAVVIANVHVLVNNVPPCVLFILQTNAIDLQSTRMTSSHRLSSRMDQTRSNPRVLPAPLMSSLMIRIQTSRNHPLTIALKSVDSHHSIKAKLLIHAIILLDMYIFVLYSIIKQRKPWQRLVTPCHDRLFLQYFVFLKLSFYLKF